jgi:hypothetical protein
MDKPEEHFLDSPGEEHGSRWWKQIDKNPTDLAEAKAKDVLT